MRRIPTFKDGIQGLYSGIDFESWKLVSILPFFCTSAIKSVVNKEQTLPLDIQSDLMIEYGLNIPKLTKIVKIVSSALRGAMEIPIIISSIELIFANHRFNLSFLRLFLVPNPCKKIMLLGRKSWEIYCSNQLATNASCISMENRPKLC